VICERCNGKGFVAFVDDVRAGCEPCPNCQGSGIVSCCDAAGSLSNPYRDPRWPERACDRCGLPYQGPAVYCSLECAIADA